MTRDEAMALAREWDGLHAEAEAEQSFGSQAEAERLLNEAMDILRRLRSEGYDPFKMLYEEGAP